MLQAIRSVSHDVQHRMLQHHISHISRRFRIYLLYIRASWCTAQYKLHAKGLWSMPPDTILCLPLFSEAMHGCIFAWTIWISFASIRKDFPLQTIYGTCVAAVFDNVYVCMWPWLFTCLPFIIWAVNVVTFSAICCVTLDTPTASAKC